MRLTEGCPLGLWPPDSQPFAIISPDSAPLDLPGLSRDLVISSDGTQVVYQSAGAQLYRQPIDQLVAAPLRGGESAAGPFFSPDGEWVGFTDIAARTPQKVSIFGGPPVTLTESLSTIRGASWGADDMILYGQGTNGIWRVPGTGGTPAQAIAVADGEQAIGPQMLPGGEWVLLALRPPDTSSWNEPVSGEGGGQISES